MGKFKYDPVTANYRLYGPQPQRKQEDLQQKLDEAVQNVNGLLDDPLNVCFVFKFGEPFHLFAACIVEQVPT